MDGQAVPPAVPGVAARAFHGAVRSGQWCTAHQAPHLVVTRVYGADDVGRRAYVGTTTRCEPAPSEAPSEAGEGQ